MVYWQHVEHHQSDHRHHKKARPMMKPVRHPGTG
jgi:hypothetical protein